MRTISLTAVALLGAALLAPVGTAAAAGETCQGQAATIVGTPGGQITGTEGADVIVTNDAIRVDALGGDDLVCATGERSSYDSATGTSTFVPAILGAGADTFIPSERSGYTIYAGTVDGTDTEADVIRLSWTAGLVISGMPGQPNADIIDLGGSGDVRWSGIQTAPGAVSAVSYSIGTGSLSVRSANGDVTMDASGTVTGVDTKLTWTGRFARLGFTTSAKYGRFTFRGTDSIEHIKVNAPTTYDRDIALGSGNDLYESNSLGGKATRIKGDIGRNTTAARPQEPRPGARRLEPFPGDGHQGGRHGLDPHQRLQWSHRGREARHRHRHRPHGLDQGRRVPDDDQGKEGRGRTLR